MGRFFSGSFSYVLGELVSILFNCADRRLMRLLRDCIFSSVFGVGVIGVCTTMGRDCWWNSLESERWRDIVSSSS